MQDPGSHTRLSLLAKILRAYNRSGLRGQTRVTMLLARKVKSLQAVPITIADWPPVYMDLRSFNSLFWLHGTPFKSSPREVDEQAVMRRFVRPGDVVFDIGANLGLHMALLAQLVGPQGRVIAFEPNSGLLPPLELTVRALKNTSLYPYALSDKTATSQLFVPADHSMGSLADWTREDNLLELRQQLGLGESQTITCEQRQMDELVKTGVIPRPDFIKCDVEGAELMVFKGGLETLNSPDAPFIVFEAGVDTARGFGLKLTDAADFLVGLPEPGYQLLALLEGGGLRYVRSADFKQHNQNVIAVPRTKAALCPELSTIVD